MPSRRDGPAASVLAGLLQQEKAHAAPPRTFPVILASLTFQLKRFFLLEELAILPTSQSRWGPQTAHHPSVCLFVCCLFVFIVPLEVRLCLFVSRIVSFVKEEPTFF